MATDGAVGAATRYACRSARMRANAAPSASSIVMIPSAVLRAARAGFGLRRGTVRVLSTRFGKVCVAHRDAAGVSQLRLVREDADTVARLHAEMLWLQHLHERHGLSVPAPQRWRTDALVSPRLHAGDGTRWHAVHCKWVPGAHLNRGLRVRHMARAGALLATMHDASIDAPPGIAAARPTWWIPRLFDLATTLRDLVAGNVAPPDGVTATFADALRTAVHRLSTAHDALPTGPACSGLIHTDAHWQNLRYTQRSVGIVDFEGFGNGRFMLDVACLWATVERRRDGDALLNGLLEGYDRVRPLQAGYQRDLRVMRAFRRLDYAGWVLSWPRLDREPWGPALLAEAPAFIESLLDR